MRFKKPKFKLKRILTFTVSLLVIGAIFFRLTSQSVEAAWFDDAYAFRVKFSFTHNANITDPRAVTYTLDTAELITANLMQSDCDDIRFADASGTALLYDLTGTCNNAATTFEVIFPTVINGTNVAYAYYSNATATNAEINSTGFTALTPSGGDPSDTNPTAADEKGPTPLIYYKFDENSGTTAYDSSPSKNNGTIDSNAYWYTNEMCISGSCLFFPGSSNRVSKSYSSDTELDPGTDSFTVSVWAKRTRAATDTDYIVSRESTGGYNIYMNSSANLCFEIVSGANTDTACTTTTYNDSQWHYITAVKTGTTDIRLYIDGTQMAIDSSIIATGSISGSSPAFSVGRNSNGNTSGEWIGFIDEVKYYNFAKTASQINAEFLSKSQNKGASASIGSTKISNSISNGLIGYWKIDETSGNLSDTSGNNLTLTNNGTTTFTGGKFGGASSHNGTTQYFSTATTISNVRSVSFWVYPASTSDDYIHLTSGVYINSSSGTVSATGFTSPNIYVNGVLNSTLRASTWNHVLVSSNTAISATAFEIGRANSAYLNNTGRMDEVRLYSTNIDSKEATEIYNWSAGPVFNLKLDENLGTSPADTSGNNATFDTWNMESQPWIPGKYGSALNFVSANNRDITYLDSNNLDIDYALTISAWARFTSVTGGGTYRSLLIKDTNYGFQMNGDEFSCFFFDGSYRENDTLSANLQTNTWYYLTWTFDETTDLFNLYINGVLFRSVTETGNISSNTNALRIGSTGGGESHDGALDDIKIYNYARTQKQIIEDMNGGHPAVGTPVGSYVGYWNLDESTGTTAYDKSPNSNNLTLSTASWTLSGKTNAAWNGTGSNPYLSRADDSDFDLTSGEDFTLSIWARSDSASNPAASQFLIDKQAATNNPGYRLYFNTSGQVVCDIDDDTTSYPEDSATTTTDYYDNTWHHIVCIRDIAKDRLLLFIDGKLIAQDTDLSATGDLSNTDTLTIGAQDTTDAGTDDFAGDLDEIKIYRLALSESDVLIEYNNAAAASFGNLGTNLSPTPQADNSLARSFCPPGDTTATCAPTAWWKLDENLGTSANDSSSNSYVGSLTNGPTWAPAKIGSGVRFDGSDDHIVSTSTSILDTGSAFTISMWVYPFSDGESGFGAMFGKAGNFAIYQSSNNTIEVCQEGASCGSTNAYSGNDALLNNQWTHVTVTHNGSGTYNFYSNSILTNGADTTGPDTNTSATIIIGASIASGVFNFDGIIDDVKIFNYVRSQSQISWDYNKGAAVLNYKFDECQGATAYNTAFAPNSTPPGINGTLTPGASGNTSTGACSSGTSTEMWNDGTTGKFNSSVGFDGTDDYITTTNTSAIDQNENLQNGLTISTWIYANTDGEGDVGRIFTKNTNTWCRVDSQSGSNIDLQCSLDLATDATLNETGTGLTTGAWNHIAMSWTNDADDEISLWVNGKLAGTSSDGAGNASADTANLIIGNDSTSGTATFDGLIDEFKIFNYELTANQMKTLFNQDSAVRFGPQTGTP